MQRIRVIEFDINNAYSYTSQVERLRKYLEKRALQPKAERTAVEAGSVYEKVHNPTDIGDYSLTQDDSNRLYYTDQNGSPVTDHYSGFDLHVVGEEDERKEVLVGRGRGALSDLLIPPSDESSTFTKAGRFHEITFRPDLGDKFVVQTGTLSTMIDDSGRRLSGNFHKIYKKDGKIFGKIGKYEYIIPQSKTKAREMVERVLKERY